MTAFRHTRRGLPLASLTRALWALSGGLLGLGCSSDADLATGYLGDTSEPVDPPRTVVLDLADPWWCLDLPPPSLREPRPVTQPVGFVLPVVEWGTLTPLAGRGLTATLCSNTQFSCASPLAPPYAVREGMLGSLPLPAGAAGVPVIEGFDGFIKFQVPSYPGDPVSEVLEFIPLSYYLGGPISGEVSQGPPLTLLQRGLWETVLQQSFPELDRAPLQERGTLMAGVFDCNGDPVSDARVEINLAGAVTPFLLPSSRIPIAQPAGSVITIESGLLGYLGVPPGAVQLRAFRRGDTEPFGRAELGIVAGEMSAASLRPAYLNDANLRGVPPCCEPGPRDSSPRR
jgi:hypothetical protein